MQHVKGHVQVQAWILFYFINTLCYSLIQEAGQALCV